MRTNEMGRTKVGAIKSKITQSRTHQILHLSLMVCFLCFFPPTLLFFCKDFFSPHTPAENKEKAVVSIGMN